MYLQFEKETSHGYEYNAYGASSPYIERAPGSDVNSKRENIIYDYMLSQQFMPSNVIYDPKKSNTASRHYTASRQFRSPYYSNEDDFLRAKLTR